MWFRLSDFFLLRHGEAVLLLFGLSGECVLTDCSFTGGGWMGRWLERLECEFDLQSLISVGRVIVHGVRNIDHDQKIRGDCAMASS